eukprot:gene991-1257_t
MNDNINPIIGTNSTGTQGFISLQTFLTVLLPIKYGILIILFYKAKLPVGFARYLGRFHYYLTLPLNSISLYVGFRGNLLDAIDEYVYLGSMPMFWNVKVLVKNDIQAVVNLCDEYDGPLSEYSKHSIDQLHLPVVDHYEPSVQEIRQAIQFIEDKVSKRHRVFVHCKAGRGRSAAIIICWIAYSQKISLERAQRLLVEKRSLVRKSLYKQKNVLAFYNHYCKHQSLQ